MLNTTALPLPPLDNSNPSLAVHWDNREYFYSCSTFAFTWNNNSTSNWYSFTPVLFSDDGSKESKRTKILEWPDVAVLEKQYSLILPQFIDQEQRKVHVELWCSNIDNHRPRTTKTLCGKSPQFTLFQPLNHLASTNLPITNILTKTYQTTTIHNVLTTGVPTRTHETATEPTYRIQTTDVFDPYITFSATSASVQKRILAGSPRPKPSSPTMRTTTTTTSLVVVRNTSRLNGLGTPTTIAKAMMPTKTPLPPKTTTTPLMTKCPMNIPNPSCLPILPSIIAPKLSHNGSSYIPTSSSSSTANTTTTTTDNTAFNNSQSYPTGASAMNGGVIAVIVIICVIVLTLGLYLLHVRRQRSRGDCGDRKHLWGGGVDGRYDDPETGSRRSSMSSLTTYGRFRSHRVTPPWSLTYNKEVEQPDGRTYPQVPPVHISRPVLVDDPARRRKRQYEHHQQRAAVLNIHSAQMQTTGGPGSSPVSPVSATSSKYRGRPSTSTRYPVTAPGGGVATIASAAHAIQSHTALPPASSEPSSPASNESEIPPTHVWSPFSGRTSSFPRKLTNTSSRSSPSRSSSIFSNLSSLSSVSPLPMDKEQDRRLRLGFKTRVLERPKLAALTRTHITPPIRSIMSISSEEGQVLARRDVLIRMEDDADDYDSDIDGCEQQQQQPWYQFKKPTNQRSNRSRTRNYRDTSLSRHSQDHNGSHHLPNQLNSSTSTLSHQGPRHYQYQQQPQQQQSRNSPRRSSLIRTSSCSSIVPLTPKVPQQNIYSTSEGSCLTRGSSAVTSLSRPIGYDPEWVDTTEDDGNYDSDYSRHGEWRRSGHGSREVSKVSGRKGSETSRPISRSIMKAVRHERSKVSPALPLSQASKWAREREQEMSAALSKGGVAAVGGGLEERHRHTGVEYY
ncbi:hypothetical protein BGZ91_000339 [Linnemannia elongata]|nr:hypothetical protein BGZ91_000339 [Linnemannia elongata]KAG0075690.1 hypothetical protein BGZ90_009599 [Linnemannia elongata]